MLNNDMESATICIKILYVDDLVKVMAGKDLKEIEKVRVESWKTFSCG